MKHPHLTISDIEQYLESLHCELWPGETFYVSQPSGRKEAAEWLFNTISDADS